MEQQLLFLSDSQEDTLERRMMKLEEKYENLRKSAHAKIGSVLKICIELKTDNERLKYAMCKNKPIYSETLF